MHVSLRKLVGGPWSFDLSLMADHAVHLQALTIPADLMELVFFFRRNPNGAVMDLTNWHRQSIAKKTGGVDS